MPVRIAWYGPLFRCLLIVRQSPASCCVYACACGGRMASAAIHGESPYSIKHCVPAPAVRPGAPPSRSSLSNTSTSLGPIAENPVEKLADKSFRVNDGQRRLAHRCRRSVRASLATTTDDSSYCFVFFRQPSNYLVCAFATGRLAFDPVGEILTACSCSRTAKFFVSTFPL